ncbi:hypothetical protein FRC12_015560, partial [Ceratobasidium sp. 428]
MPTEQLVHEPGRPFEAAALPPPAQIKLCSNCNGPLADTAQPVFSPGHMSPDDVCATVGV